ncbi:MAG: hypothetical protein KDK70_11565 [Myxococcales bacterium]|nr:hypothetical protein [Myxococcales bacterium]
MDSKQELAQALDSLRRNRVSLQLDAEVDPGSLVVVATDLAERTGLPREVALRVVEDELGVKPLPPRSAVTKGATVMDIQARLAEARD